MFLVLGTMGMAQNFKILKIIEKPDTLILNEKNLLSLISNADVTLKIDTNFKGIIQKTIIFDFKDKAMFNKMSISSTGSEKDWKIKYIEIDDSQKPWIIKPRHFRIFRYVGIKINDFLIRY
jgi:hypothetical protein